MKILVLAAHPDDEILGMGGTIRKFTKNKNQVKIVIMATGISARRSSNYSNSTSYEISEKLQKKMKNQINILRDHAQKAAKILGVKDIQFENFPDNEMDKVSNLEITKKIEKIIKSFNPIIVYTHSPHDVNIDHQKLYYATLTATRPKVNSNVKKVITFEIPSSTEWFFPTQFSPNIFVDITSELPTKIKAMKEYKTELKKFPHPRSSEALKTIAKRWGTVSGFKAAEAFNLVRSLEKKI